MADKVIFLNTSGNLQEREALTTSSGAADAGKIGALGLNGKFDKSMIPDLDVQEYEATENIAAGALVNLYDVAGTVKARNADASGGVAKKADGVAPNAIASGATGEVVKDDALVAGYSGLTPAAQYFLSATTPGGMETAPPTTTGYIAQKVGKADGATSLSFHLGEPIVRA